jgi:hypothetical protein
MIELRLARYWLVVSAAKKVAAMPRTQRSTRKVQRRKPIMAF